MVNGSVLADNSLILSTRGGSCSRPHRPLDQVAFAHDVEKILDGVRPVVIPPRQVPVPRQPPPSGAIAYELIHLMGIVMRFETVDEDAVVIVPEDFGATGAARDHWCATQLSFTDNPRERPRSHRHNEHFCRLKQPVVALQIGGNVSVKVPVKPNRGIGGAQLLG